MTQPAQPLFTFLQKSNVQVHDDYIRVIKNGLIGQGIPNPNVGPSSDYDLQGTAIGNEMAVVHSNTVILADQLMPDTAGGSYLDRWLAIFGLGRKEAIGSTGNISAPCSVSTPILVPSGAQLTDSTGLRYQVQNGGTYTAGSNGNITIPIFSVDTGSATNHENGDVLQWVVAPPFCQQNVTVGAVGGTDGLEGGNDSEVGLDEPPRSRLLSDLQNPPKSGNPADIMLWAGQSNPIVQATWVYPALLGPATVFFLVAQAPQVDPPFSSTSKNRSISNTIVNNVIAPFVQGLLPTRAFCVGASTVDVPADIAILVDLPSAPTASPPGPGGGWLDGTPWPQSISGSLPVTVSASPAPTSTSFTVNAQTAPSPGVSHVAWFSPLSWQLTTAIVTSVSGSAGAYAVTVDTPMVGLAAGHFIFPAAVNTPNYVAAALAAFSLMGPGEWVAPGSGASQRSFRHPIPSQQWPSALGGQFLKQITNSGQEVEDASWIYRSVGAGSPTVPSTITVNSTTAQLTSTAPGLYVPRNIAFYAQ
jgi:hypothetical protein